jgi:hypothetical protein
MSIILLLCTTLLAGAVTSSDAASSLVLSTMDSVAESEYGNYAPTGGATITNVIHPDRPEDTVMRVDYDGMQTVVRLGRLLAL